MKLLLTYITALIVSILLAACGDAQKGMENGTPRSTATSEIAQPEILQNLLELRAVGLSFEGPNEIASGWTTIRFSNLSGMAHFALVERLPNGVTPEILSNEVGVPFQRGMDLLNAGDPEGAAEVFSSMPDWFGGIVFLGGPGLLSGNHTAEATIYLEPGQYSIECYVKTGGVFHQYNPDPNQLGMVHELTVTDEISNATEPDTNVTLAVSSDGYKVDGVLQVGTNTIRTEFRDQIVYSNFVGHDVHVIRVEADTDLDVVAKWMDWTNPDGFETPAPATFIGGTNEMPAGEIAYFTINLEPGDYAFIAEVPNPAEKGFFLPFTVRK